MSIRNLLAPVAAAAAVLMAPLSAQAGLVIQISDGTNTLNIADGSSLDAMSDVGAISYAGAFDGWNFVVAFASGAADPLVMHLSAVVFGNQSDGRLSIKFTQTDLVAGTGPVAFNAGGGGQGSGTASWAAYVDDSNAAFGSASTIFNSDTYVPGANGTWAESDTGWASVGLTGTYSATLVTNFDYRGIANPFIPYGSSLDVGMNVPEPTSLALLGLGLAGIGLTRRRKA